MEGAPEPDGRLRPPLGDAPEPAREPASSCAPRSASRVGEAPTNQITFDEGKLYDDSLFQFAPTVGFAWDPFGTGKTSLRANYRLAWDRTNTFVFSSFIFQSAPGLTRGVTLTASDLPGGANTALLRNGLPRPQRQRPHAAPVPHAAAVRTGHAPTSLTPTSSTRARTSSASASSARSAGTRSSRSTTSADTGASSSAATTPTRWTSLTTAS